MLSMSDCFTSLDSGDRATIIGYQGLPDSYRKKLMNMGLTPGTQFQVKRSAPLGDPIEISVRGFSLSLRKQEANGLLISRIEVES
jgi:ferrous iron transport protein A